MLFQPGLFHGFIWHDSGAARNFVREEPVTHVDKNSIFSYFAQRSFRCHSSISGLLQQDMTSNIFHQSASNSGNWYEASAKNIIRWLTHIINEVWHSENLPEDWARGIILPFWKKKGDKLVCSNHGGIPFSPFLARSLPVSYSVARSQQSVATGGHSKPASCQTAQRSTRYLLFASSLRKLESFVRSVTCTLLSSIWKLRSTTSTTPRYGQFWHALVCLARS